MTPPSSERAFLDGYVGIKYEARQQARTLEPAARRLFPLFKRCGERLAAHDMTPANGGNMSVRMGHEILVTTAGANLGILEPDELALVHDWSLCPRQVQYSGPREPTSEALMHALIYRRFAAAGAVLHAHDTVVTAGAHVAGMPPETDREAPYGTVDLASLAVEAFRRGSNLIVLKSHGYVAHAATLEAVTDIIVDKHLELRDAGGG